MDHKNNWNNVCIFGSVLLILIGIVAVFMPWFLMMFLSIFIGISLLCFGIAQLYQGIIQMDVIFIGATRLVYGLICSIIGVLFFFYPYMAYHAFSITFGLWAVVYGAIHLNLAIQNKQDGEPIAFNVVKGIVNMIFGVIIIIFPVTAATIWMVLMGIYLIFLGVCILISVNKRKKLFIE